MWICGFVCIFTRQTRSVCMRFLFGFNVNQANDIYILVHETIDIKFTIYIQKCSVAMVLLLIVHRISYIVHMHIRMPKKKRKNYHGIEFLDSRLNKQFLVWRISEIFDKWQFTPTAIIWLKTIDQHWNQNHEESNAFLCKHMETKSEASVWGKTRYFFIYSSDAKEMQNMCSHWQSAYNAAAVRIRLLVFMNATVRNA